MSSKVPVDGAHKAVKPAALDRQGASCYSPLEAASSSTRGSGWGLSGPASPWECRASLADAGRHTRRGETAGIDELILQHRGEVLAGACRLTYSCHGLSSSCRIEEETKSGTGHGCFRCTPRRRLRWRHACLDAPQAAASASVARSSRAQSVSIMSAPDGRVDREADAAVKTRLRQQQRSMPSAGRLMAAAVRK